MGQGFGLPITHPDVKPFTNLPREAIESLWTSYNLFGEGWGLDFYSLSSIFSGATYFVEHFGYSEPNVRKLFDAFDTDKNGLVDALEMLISIALVSGMDTIDKINFAFNAFDFESTETLFFDEINLLLRSSATGLQKSCPAQPVFAKATHKDAEAYATLFFQSLGKERGSSKISLSEFRSYCSTHPVLSSWLKIVSLIPPAKQASQPVVGLDDLEVLSYRPWASYASLDSSIVRFKPVIKPVLLATTVTDEDQYVPPPPPPPEPVVKKRRGSEEELTSTLAGSARLTKDEEGNDVFEEITAEEDEVRELARKEAEARANAVPPPPPPPLTWIAAANRMIPEELPPIRKDPAQDSLTPLWLHGFGSSSAPRMRRNSFYTATGAIVYPASNNIVVLKKDEEGAWSQRVLSEHKMPLACMDIDPTGRYLVSADRVVSYDLYGKSTSQSTSVSQINVWDLSSGSVLGSIAVPPFAGGVRHLDYSSNGKLILALLEDEKNTINIYCATTYTLVFTKELYEPCRFGEKAVEPEKIMDIKFSGTNSIFATAGTAGVNFFVEEGSSFMGPKGFKSYEKRIGLYQTVGREAESTVASVLSRFEYPDETVSGTTTGQLLLWRGRNCIQLLQAHNGTVTSLNYSPSSKTLASGGKDGRINLYTIAALGSTSTRKGPKLVQARQLEQTVTFDLMGQPGIISSYVRSIFLSPDAVKILVGTFGGELKELSCLAVNPDAAEGEGEEAPPPTEEGEGGEPAAPMSNLGKDINGGSLVKAHFIRDVETKSKDVAVSSLYQLYRPKSSIVTGLCKIPGGFMSCGGDGTVRAWSAAEGEAHKCTKVTILDSGCLGIAASATLVAVSLDGAQSVNRKGVVQILTFPDLNFVTDLKVAPGETIHDLKFAAEGNLLAVSSGDKKVHFYSELEGVWTEKGTIATVEPVLAFDFSSDSLFFRTCDKNPTDEKANYNLRFWDISANFGAEVVIAELIRTMTWNTNSVPCSWDTKGVWSGLVEVEDNYESLVVDPFNPPPPIIKRIVPICSIDRNGALMLSGRSDGSVSFHRVPAPEYEASPSPVSQVIHYLHSGKVSSILFIEEGARLVTAGADDGLIQVWRVNYDAEEAEPDPEDLPPKVDEEEEAPPADEEEEGPIEVLVQDSADDEDLIDGNEMKLHLTVPFKSSEPLSALQGWPEFVGLTPVGLGSAAGEHFVDASDGSELPGCDSAHQLPSAGLELEWVHGYSARLTRASVRYNHQGHIVYPASTFGVIFNKAEERQALNSSLCDEVSCLDVHMRGVAATSHKGAGNIFVSVWNSVTGQLLKRLDCGKVNGASAICFNPANEQILAVACQDEVHSIFIFNWQAGQLLSRIQGSRKKILCLSFSLSALAPLPPVLDANGLPVVTFTDENARKPLSRLLAGGVGHFRLIDRAVGSMFTARSGLFGPEVKKSNVLCVAALPVTYSPDAVENEFLMGMSDGTIGSVPKGAGRLATFTPVLLNENGVNTGSVTSLWVVKLKEPGVEEPPEYRIVMGSTIGVIKVLDQELQPLSEFNLYGKTSYGLSAFGKIRGFKSVCVDKGNRKILYATAGGEIGEIDLEKGVDLNNGPVVNGHFRDQLHGLAVHPMRPECVTSGDDKMLRVWNLESHRQILSIALPDISRACAYSPNGLIIAAGMGGTVTGKNRKLKREFAGQIAIISYMQEELRIVYVAEDCTNDVTSLVFSPDGGRLYAGSADCNVYVFDAFNNFKLLETLPRHSEPILSLDISLDGAFLVSTGVQSEVTVWDTSSFDPIGEQIAPLLLAQQWYSREGKFNIDALGLFPLYGRISDVTCFAQSTNQKLIASGTPSGTVDLRRSPANAINTPCKKYEGHSPGGVTRVAFTYADQFLLSLGRDDKVLLQWKVIDNNTEGLVSLGFSSGPYISPPRKLGTSSSSVPKQGAFDSSFFTNDVDFSVCPKGPDNRPLSVSLNSIVAVGVPPDGVPGANTLLRAVYCGVGDILTCFGKIAFSVLDDHLTQKTWLPAPLTNLSGDPVEKTFVSSNPSDTTVAVARMKSTVQKISAMAVSSCGRYVLLGGDGSDAVGTDIKGVVYPKSLLGVYSVSSGSLLTLLADDILGGINSVGFSVDGLFCAALIADPLRTIKVYGTSDVSLDWSDAVLLSSVPSSTQVNDTLVFIVPHPSQAIGTRFDFVTGGENNPTFWTINGRNLTGCVGIVTEAVPIYPTTALAALKTPQWTVSGDSGGFLWLWNGNTREVDSLGSHNGPVTALVSFTSDSGSGAISGSIDSIKIWDTTARVLLKEISLVSLLSRVNRAAYLAAPPAISATRSVRSIIQGETAAGFISSIFVDAVFKRILLSFSTGIVLEIAHDSGSTVLLAESNGGKVSAVVAHPREPNTIVTASQDKLLRLWNVLPTETQRPSVVSMSYLPHPVTTMEFLDDKTLAVAVTGGDSDANSGSIFLYSISNRKSPSTAYGPNGEGHGFVQMDRDIVLQHKLHNVGKGAIVQIRFSLPAGESGPIKLVACSEDGGVYVYELIAGTHSIAGSILVDPSRYPLQGADFSVDGRYLRTFSRTSDASIAVDVRFFDFTINEVTVQGNKRVVLAAEVIAPEKLTELRDTAVFSSIASPAVAEARAVMKKGEDGFSPALNALGTSTVAPVSLTSTPHPPSAQCDLISAGYSDGTFSVFRYPAIEGSASATGLHLHSSSPVYTVFLADGKSLCTVGADDGCILLWEVNS